MTFFGNFIFTLDEFFWKSRKEKIFSNRQPDIVFNVESMTWDDTIKKAWKRNRQRIVATKLICCDSLSSWKGSHDEIVLSLRDPFRCEYLCYEAPTSSFLLPFHRPMLQWNVEKSLSCCSFNYYFFNVCFSFYCWVQPECVQARLLHLIVLVDDENLLGRN